MLSALVDGGGGSGDEVICVRTNHYDAELDRFIENTLLPSGRPVVLLADESAGPLDAPGHRQKIPLHPAAMGLHMPPDAMWRCGDYCLYAAINALPQARYIWLVEPDVRIHSERPATLFDGADPSRPRADFVTAWFVTASPEWSWFATIAPFYPATSNCMLQLARFSRPFVEALLEARLVLSRRFANEGRPSAAWPNDEAFIGAIARGGRFRIETLREHAPGFSTDGTFTFIKPTSGRVLGGVSPDDRIYHPVLYGQSFLRRARLYLNERIEASRDVDRFMAEFPSAFVAEVMAEIGDEAGRAFYDEIKSGALRVARRAAATAAVSATAGI